jgi:hypothetical protein
MELTKITYKEAAKLINRSYQTILNAVDRNGLTPFPIPGLLQYLAKEQVELFANTSQIRYDLLTDEKKQTWQVLKREIENYRPNPPDNSPDYTPINEDELSERIAKRVVALMEANRGVPVNNEETLANINDDIDTDKKLSASLADKLLRTFKFLGDNDTDILIELQNKDVNKLAHRIMENGYDEETAQGYAEFLIFFLLDFVPVTQDSLKQQKKKTKKSHNDIPHAS